MKRLVALLMFFAWGALALARAADTTPQTIWEQLPEGTQARYQFFRSEDTTGAFERYEQGQRGTRFLFACVNAYTFNINYFVRDDVWTAGQVSDIAENVCSTLVKPFEHDADAGDLKDMAVPLGTPVVLDFSVDEEANRSYAAMKSQWDELYYLDDIQAFLFKSNIKTGSKAIRSAWVLRNFSMRFNPVAASAKSIADIDCQNHRERTRSMVLFSKKYAKGKELKRFEGPSQWTDIAPDSSGEELAKAICHRK